MSEKAETKKVENGAPEVKAEVKKEEPKKAPTMSAPVSLFRTRYGFLFLMHAKPLHAGSSVHFLIRPLICKCALDVWRYDNELEALLLQKFCRCSIIYAGLPLQSNRSGTLWMLDPAKMVN